MTTAASGVQSSSSTASSSVIPLSNVEAQWEKMSAEEQLTVHQQLEAIQKKDWKTLSVDEKKAGASFGLAARHFFAVVVHATERRTSY